MRTYSWPHKCGRQQTAQRERCAHCSATTSLTPSRPTRLRGATSGLSSTSVAVIVWTSAKALVGRMSAARSVMTERARMGLSMARAPGTVKAQGIPPAVLPPISLLPHPPLPRRHWMRIRPQSFPPRSRFVLQPFEHRIFRRILPIHQHQFL